MQSIMRDCLNDYYYGCQKKGYHLENCRKISDALKKELKEKRCLSFGKQNQGAAQVKVGMEEDASEEEAED